MPALIVRAAGMAVRTVVVAAVVSAVGALAFFGIGPHILPYRTMTVLSGSMTPRFSPGDVVVVTPEAPQSLRVGQVVTYNVPVAPHEPITHRVVAILHRGEHPVIRTKGDANAAPDPWTARLNGSQVWRQRWVIPDAGWVIEWLRRPSARYPLTIGIPLLVCLLWLREIWARPERKPEAEAHAPDPA
ncbi:MAG: signal peptidase I [Gaiellales bacterium]